MEREGRREENMGTEKVQEESASLLQDGREELAMAMARARDGVILIMDFLTGFRRRKGGVGAQTDRLDR
jgi:hypothetical protein